MYKKYKKIQLYDISFWRNNVGQETFTPQNNFLIILIIIAVNTVNVVIMLFLVGFGLGFMLLAMI